MTHEVAVALLRGINVGGNKRIPMADLRRIVSDAGGTEVSTYIQSGNVVLRSSDPPDELEHHLEAALATATGFEVPVLVRTRAELDDIVTHGPYAEETDGTKRVVTFARSALPGALLDAVDLTACAPETAALRGRELYLHLPNGQGRALLPDLIARALPPGIATTTRNWRTVERLHAMAVELDQAD